LRYRCNGLSCMVIKDGVLVILILNTWIILNIKPTFYVSIMIRVKNILYNVNKKIRNYMLIYIQKLIDLLRMF